MTHFTESRRRMVMLLAFIIGDDKVYRRVTKIWKDHNKYLKRKSRYV